MELAIYKIDWSDMQLGVVTPDGREGYTINAGRVTSGGVELAVTYWPIDAFHLAIQGAYSDAHATEAVPAAGISVGARLPGSPRWMAGATLDCHLGQFDRWNSYLSGSWRYIAPQYSALSTQPGIVGLQPGYSWVDVNLGMTKGRYDLSLYAKNLLDKHAFNNSNPYAATTAGPGAPVPPGPPSPSFAGNPIQPRVAGLSVTVTL